MKQGGYYAKKSAGFTIAETMIVLGVSAGLFLIAALYIGGKQAKTEFQVGARDIQTQLQQIINQTESGYYGTQSNSKCTLVDGDPSVTVGSGNLGSNGECIFIGKAIVVDSDKLYVYPLVGKRQVAGEDTSNPIQARATVALPSGVAPSVFILPNGITLSSSSYDGIFTSGYARGFAILSSMADTTGADTGSQTFRLYGFNGTFELNKLADTYKNVIDNEKTLPVTNAYAQKKSVGLCLKSGGTIQSVLITMGGDSGLALQSEIMSGALCGM